MTGISKISNAARPGVTSALPAPAHAAGEGTGLSNEVRTPDLADRSIWPSLPVQGGGVVAFLAHVQAEEHLVAVVHISPRHGPQARPPCLASTAGSHVTKRPTPDRAGRPDPYERSVGATPAR